MELSVLTICYLIGSLAFIIGLKMLSNPATARKGNLIAAAGMVIAIAGTIFLYESEGEKLHNYGWIFGGLLVGTIVGTVAARKVKMTAMPEMVSLFNGMGGACAALISIIEFDHISHRVAGFDSIDFIGCNYRFSFFCRQYYRLGKIKWKH
jgi:H+-translocating NAD(P) transhydrogenase subunit beta